VQVPDTPEAVPAEVEGPLLRSPHRVGQRLIELAGNVLGCVCIGLASVDPATAMMCPMAVVGLSSEYERQWWLAVQRATIDDFFPASVVACLRVGGGIHRPYKRALPYSFQKQFVLG